jgi:2-polyprenyl-6-methoxyphenol hydroxylase-like FAD-dependent oxidoreductase
MDEAASVTLGKRRILVVGGGIAGLTFGVAANRLGLDVVVVERARSVTTGAAGIR